MGRDGAKMGQDGAKMGQDGAKIGQDGAKMGQDGQTGVSPTREANFLDDRAINASNAWFGDVW